jgi:hypothetical protein
MSFHHPFLLIGLIAVLIPPVVYHLARRHPQEVGWGAMQFLRLTPARRRRLQYEAGLQLVLRMLVIGLAVIAVAGPVVRGTWLARAESRQPRNVVLLIDASASTAAGYGGVTAIDLEKRRAGDVLDRLWPGDRVVVLAVRTRVHSLLAQPTADREAARAALDLVSRPNGTADWPAAFTTAARLFDGATAEPDVVVITDGRATDWNHQDVLGWGVPPARVFVMDVTGGSLSDPAPVLGPLVDDPVDATEGTVVRVSGTVSRVSGCQYPRVRAEIDDRPAGELAVAPDGRFALTRRFSAGSHLVTVRLDPDDRPGATRRDLALDVRPSDPGGSEIVTRRAGAQDGREPGVYRETGEGGRVRYFVVQPDPREWDLTPVSTAELERVAAENRRMEFVHTPDELDKLRGRGKISRDVWWLALVLAVGVLAGERYLTWRGVRHGPP